ncbi:hypothetical protein M404DRAFT_29605 [Pisolithus tinctorius Marx 270]|uniref:Uncharacterized protein n=1 Tax=Pisolithus tinctorius Marx 270 TaxID=870435 RepID=A0A0C3NHG5_PISTI|nr:hypothetical protein M404DRAFT_29605 [Pisolithus tinctorius Marx 270]
MDEAKLVMQTLDSVLQPILPEPTTHDLVTFLNKSPAVRDLLKDTGDSFYAVVVGNPPGVHRTEEGATRAGSSFHWAKWKRTDTLHEALVYMAVKGIEDQLPRVVTVDEVAESITLQDADVVGLQDADVVAPRLTQSVPSQACGHSMSAPPPIWRDSGSRTSPIIYAHVRSLRGITESRHHYSENTATYIHAQVLGAHAARYLTAHGYMCEAIDTIICARNGALSDHVFALQLSQHGLAMAEALYLWHLIQLQ